MRATPNALLLTVYAKHALNCAHLLFCMACGIAIRPTAFRLKAAEGKLRSARGMAGDGEGRMGGRTCSGIVNKRFGVQDGVPVKN
jgi:hypothetical protein